jgi:hypothetical protein
MIRLITFKSYLEHTEPLFFELKILNIFKINVNDYLSCWYVAYYLQHERPCYIGYTNSSRRREFVYPIQHGREINVVNGLKNDSSYEFIGEVILKINDV